MTMPKFNTDHLVDKAIQYGDRLMGHSANKYTRMAKTLDEARRSGIGPVPHSTIDAAFVKADRAKKESLHTRVKTGIGAAAVTSAGFLGIHKYLQHKDNQILARIDKFYTKE